MGLVIDREKCIGCGACAAACPFGALSLDAKGKAHANEACTACGSCVEACPVGALRIEAAEKKAGGINLDEWRGVWVYAEQREGALHGVSFELLGEGRVLADKLGVPLTAVLLGSGVEALVSPLFEHGADRVILADHPALAAYTAETYAEAMAALVIADCVLRQKALR